MASIRFTSITVPGPSVRNNSPFLPRSSPKKSVFLGYNHKRGLNVGTKCSRNPPPGNSSSKAVLDAFFIGKAFAEALNERLGAAVGEFLSEVGRLQAEQQKQTRDFQEEVLERAKLAREKAAREALGKEKEKEKDSSSSSQISSTAVSTDSSSVSNDSSLPVVPNSTSSNSEVSNTDST